ncbi:hypothetical protein [Mesomycoplasma ovipneumoniae]|uniref:hypothetical protein n=1 Tax=Mesomycoplasma ovipneumoniae TaxID=29562 RepID=UPI0028AC392E|nr:hypothetical protein [Mesomycoplasma ovipneumoniae]WNM16269.1 hypothetical protein RNM19_02770 [Mesomycoplasma ovipneumoniae]
MKKKQKQLSPIELEIEKFAKKYVDSEKFKKEDSRNKISVIFETFIQELSKVELNQHLDYEKQPKQKFRPYWRASNFAFCIRVTISKYC